MALLRAPQPLPDYAVTTALINDLAARTERLVLILDDYHEIGSASIHADLAFLIDHLPETLRLIVSTRQHRRTILTRPLPVAPPRP